MVLERNLFEAIFIQEFGEIGIITPQDLYDLCAIYSLQLRNKLKFDFNDLPDFS
ncbi:hypothetical protein DSO57_1005604 [Entomophthora muscae]|uniref:Uncharacterized protein n=1 Tax=Entomophthora muscae TaxID=34485 RepID=A0ACC2RMP2_9FUNG|nr:hypothetical protein DSO57_1005604 [Entomophthora muscae]